MSTGVNSSLDDQAQKAGNPEEAVRSHIDAALKNTHTCLPGIITAVDLVGSQTCTVQLAIQRVFTDTGPVNLPPCVDVPLQFPSGGNFVITFPVAAGDECICVFSERCIDFWHANGGVQLPAEYRMHDLSDAFAIVGVRSLPRKLTNVQTDGMELRTINRSTYIKLTEGTITIKGNIVHDGNQTSTGTITGTTDVVGGGKSVKTHVHSGVQAGGSNTGGPV
jgi:hypothetical protein